MKQFAVTVSPFPMLNWREMDKQLYLLTEALHKACCAIVEYRFQHLFDPEPVDQKT